MCALFLSCFKLLIIVRLLLVFSLTQVYLGSDNNISHLNILLTYLSYSGVNLEHAKQPVGDKITQMGRENIVY